MLFVFYNGVKCPHNTTNRFSLISDNPHLGASKNPNVLPSYKMPSPIDSFPCNKLCHAYNQRTTTLSLQLIISFSP